MVGFTLNVSRLSGPVKESVYKSDRKEVSVAQYLKHSETYISNPQ